MEFCDVGVCVGVVQYDDVHVVGVGAFVVVFELFVHCERHCVARLGLFDDDLCCVVVVFVVHVHGASPVLCRIFLVCLLSSGVGCCMVFGVLFSLIGILSVLIMFLMGCLILIIILCVSVCGFLKIL